MKYLLLLCLAAFVSAHSRFDEIGEEIADFAAEVHNFMNSVPCHTTRSETMHNTWHLDEARMNKIQPTGCDDTFQLQCGGDHPKCISRLLICDEVKDCPNGADEHQCRIYTPVGSKWKLTFSNDKCTSTKPHEATMTITDYHVPEELPSFPEVTAEVHMEAHRDEFTYTRNLHLVGVMDLKVGEHKLFFEPPDNDGLAMECIFDGVHDDHCHGSIVHVRNEEPCANFYMERID